MKKNNERLTNKALSEVLMTTNCQFKSDTDQGLETNKLHLHNDHNMPEPVSLSSAILSSDDEDDDYVPGEQGRQASNSLLWTSSNCATR